MSAFAAVTPFPALSLASLLPAGWRGRVVQGAAAPRATGVTISSVDRDSRADGPSDESLMLDFLDGSRAAFEALVDRYQGELHAFIYRFLNSAAAADDVFQETFLQLYQSAHTFDPARRFRPWLFTIAANKARDWHRRHRSRGEISLDAPISTARSTVTLADLTAGRGQAPGERSEVADEAALVKTAVDGLPPALREILLLSYFQRLSYAQISETLGIPLGTVKSRLHAAVAAFAEQWRAMRPDEDADQRTSSS